jgi:hypothetical protein
MEGINRLKDKGVRKMVQDENAHEQTDTESTASDRLLLKESIRRLFNSHFSEVLDILSSRFPHVKGDGSPNELEFNGLRAKVLRSGNNKIRQIPDVMNDFDIVKARETVVETVQVGTPVETR